MYNIISTELKNEVLDYVKNFHLDEQGYFIEEDVDFFVSEMEEDKDFDYDTGATKCVILPENKDYVIKIPFNGIKCSCEDCEKCDDPLYCTENSCPLVSLCGGGGIYGDNYCELERERYEIIEEKYPEFKDFFLPTVLVGEIKHYPIYIQSKVETFDEAEYSIDVSKKSENIVSSKNAVYCSAPLSWRAKCFEDLGGDIEKYNRFINMLTDLRMTGDLHSKNVGYYHNHAVVLDYAGFYD